MASSADNQYRHSGSLQHTERLGGKGLPLAGHVMYKDGRALGPASLYVLVYVREGTGTPDHHPTFRAVVDGTGAFRLEGLPPGLAEVCLVRPNSPAPTGAFAWTVEVGREDLLLEVEASGSGTILLHALGPNGQPVSRGEAKLVYLDCLPRRGERLEIVSGFAEASSPPEQGRVLIDVAGAQGPSGDCLAAGTFGPYRLPCARIDINLAPALRVCGRVLAQDGRGIADIGVWACARRRGSYHGYDRLWFHARTRTSEDGSFRLDGLADMNYWILLEPTDRLPPVRRVAVPAGTEGLEFRFPRPVSAKITVFDSGDQPVDSACVRVLGSEGLRRFAIADSQGCANIEGLDPNETYSLQVEPGSGAPSGIGCYSQEDWGPSDTVVRLSHVYSFKGLVVNAEGQPEPRSSVWWWSESQSEWRIVGPSPHHLDGTFVLADVPSPTVRLCATTFGGHPEEPESAELIGVAGTGDLMIQLPHAEFRHLTIQMENLPRGQHSGAALLVAEDESGVWRSGDWLGEGLRFPNVPCRRSYGLLVYGVRGGLMAEVPGIRPDQDVPPVRLVPGLELRGEIHAPEDADRWAVFANPAQGHSVRGEADSEGRFTFGGLTPGRWRVVGIAYQMDRRWRGSVLAEPGDSVRLELTPSPR